METPFAGSIVGSWHFVRSSHPGYDGKTIYHFTGDGLSYWEFNDGRGRMMEVAPYKFENGQMFFGRQGGWSQGRPVVQEGDGTSRLASASGNHFWWMVRLQSPEPYSQAFVNDEGEFRRLDILA
ncbi:hypothetical protein [Verrucomicrobium sp. BvORR106]|uniref:hypothetical protein n=1 Tax=Verrucomicrobium sp. BvORR106 TaxID=1403819 RepID=UPI00056EDE3E|nr:hypothetical protein [Verrucomicrobium sp. BvORR106]